MRGIPIGFWEKSNFFGSIGSLKGAKIARPCKNLFRDHFDPIFLHRKGWGMKIT